LHAATPSDREAFILYAIEGFSIDEISSITDHAPESVRKSIQNAREKLRHSFPVHNPFKDKLLQATGTD
jgi:DNA-directed RNA polymerase specialized sigma24 family protein